MDIDIQGVLGPLLVLIGLALIAVKEVGANKLGPLEFLEKINVAFNTLHPSEWGPYYKEKIRELSSAAFVRMKMRGVTRIVKSKDIASKGYVKLKQLINLTKEKPQGRVLSLCCGRGGWEQLIAPSPNVTDITSVTFGRNLTTRGHEDFKADYFDGKEKVTLLNRDARNLPYIDHDTLLFDGGESHPDYGIESSRFNELFSKAVLTQIRPSTKVFFLKVLTPTDTDTLDMMKEVQRITGRGSLFRVASDRNSTLEVYLVSTKKANLDDQRKHILRYIIKRALKGAKPETLTEQTDYEQRWSEITPKPVPLLKSPNYDEAIKELGTPVAEQGRDYRFWKPKGVYPVGTEGSSAMKYNRFSMRVMSRAVPSIEGFDNWKLTNTTPEGFTEVFSRKVDTAPQENHKYEKELHKVWCGLANYFRYKGFVLKELTWEEVQTQANKQGAAGYNDMVKNVGEFLQDKSWRKIVEKIRAGLLAGKPIGVIFNTMGKREKKKIQSAAGSRMVAFLSIAARLLELKLFGNLLKLTKKEINRFGVGGLGLHDIGMRLNEVWLGHAISDDIAGFDTRMSLYDMSLQYDFLEKLGANESHKRMYEVYAHPLILVPIPSEFRRSELLQGRGQCMSGRNPTYAMNTIDRLAKALMQVMVVRGTPLNEIESAVFEIMKDTTGKVTDIGGCISGDDCVITSKHEVEMLMKMGPVLDEMGNQRKDVIRGRDSVVYNQIEEVEFCSHHYERITYFDSDTGESVYRYMPTRDVSEIVAKACYRVGGPSDMLSEMGWASAQGNNLIVNYHHLRTVRAMGIALKSVVHPNCILADTGGFIKPTPWMKPGQILDICNEVLFGESTKYPVPGFSVKSIRHLGYISPKREVLYDVNAFSKARQEWRRNLYRDCERIVRELDTGGDLQMIEEWARRRLD